MADFRNKCARVLDVQTWKEVKEIVLILSCVFIELLPKPYHA